MQQNTPASPYALVDQTGVSIDGLNIGHAVSEIHEQGYTVVEQFLTNDVIEPIREAFNTEVPITEMRFLGATTGNTWRAHNLLAKTRAIEELLLDSRLRAIVEGVIGKFCQINIATLFNTLPGDFNLYLHQY